MSNAVDVICGSEVELDQALAAGLFCDAVCVRPHYQSHASDKETRRFYFCCPMCKTVFELAPTSYTGDCPATYADDTLLKRPNAADTDTGAGI